MTDIPDTSWMHTVANMQEEIDRLRDENERLKVYLIREVARRKRLLRDCVGPDFNYTRGGVDALQAVHKFIDSEEE